MDPTTSGDMTGPKTSGDLAAVTAAAERREVSPDRFAVALAVVTTLVVALGSRSLTRPLWRDEVVSATVAERSALDLWRVVTAAEANMAGFYVVLRSWVLLFEDGVLAMRVFALAGTAASVVATTMLARRYLGQTAALVSGGTVGLVLVMSGMGVEVRSYPWLPALASALLIAAERVSAAPCRRRTAVYAALVALSVSFHLAMVLLVLSQLAGGLLHARVSGGWRHLLAADLLADVLLAPLVPVVVLRAPVQTSWLQRFTLQSLIAPHLGSALRTVAVVASVTFLLLARAVGIRRMWTYPRDRAGPLLVLDAVLPVAGLLALSFLRPLFSWRYAIPFLPAWVVLAVHALPRYRPLRTLLVLVGALAATVGVIRRPAPYRVEDLRTAAEVVAHHSQPNDGLVFVPAFAEVGVQYYLRRTGRSEGPEKLAARPSNPHVVFPPPPDPAALFNDVPSHPRIWVVGYPNDRWRPSGPDATSALRDDLLRTSRLGFTTKLGDIVVERYDLATLEMQSATDRTGG